MPLLDSGRITCPWCGERFEVLLDGSAGSADYSEDCPVCCRPILLHLDADGDAESPPQVWGERE